MMFYQVVSLLLMSFFMNTSKTYRDNSEKLKLIRIEELKNI